MSVALYDPDACPFTTVVLRDDGHDVYRRRLVVKPDEQWTLRMPVDLSDRPTDPDHALLIWCIGPDEVFQTGWDRAQRNVKNGSLPAGTSLLRLMSEA